MKLTAFLRKILPLMMAVATVTVGTSNSYAGVMHTGVSPTTYTDFGQNTGRYTTNPNALLEYLRMRDGGIVINYTNGQPCYTIANEQGMISYASQTDNGAAAAVGYSYIATVEHNGEIDASFGQRYLGEGNNIRYSAIEYRSIHSFRNVPDTDYKVTRQSKIITDVSPSAVYTGDVSSLTGSLSYRAGAGTMYVRDAAGNQQYVMEAYEYIIGGINTIDSAWYNDNDTKQSYSVYWEVDYTDGGLYDGPLANSLGAGDSGSPVWVYNAATGQYEYLSASQSGNIATINFARGAGEYTQAVIDAHTVAVPASSSSTVYLNAVGTDAVSTVTDSDVTAHVWQGTVTDGSNTTAFNGVKSGVNTWANLAGLKDTSNWYNYGEDYLNAVWSSTTDTKPLTYADLFMTSNLRFSSSSASTSIVLTDTVDLGVGYAQFSGSGKSYYIISEEGENNLFNHAGYVVDAGVSVHLQLTNSADYMYEWRKVGAGDLYIDGTGNTNAFLNVGGSGKTYLSQNEGHAAYNVLANNGAVVVLSGGSSQIERDFTFGLGGGVLDMHGHSLTWNNGNAASADGFTIHALDELAVVANLKSGSTTTLTWTQGGQQTFLGSFADNDKDSALQFVYEGGAGARLDLHSINTHLTATGSGMVVNSGTLALSGTNTVHGLGSESGTNLNRYHNALDWHYADAAADVTVNDGATFELGSHARLTGDVTVAAGGTFIMREGVQHAQEYIEGGSYLESTAAIADFYGLKGNVSLASGATMQVAYGAGVTANNIYSGSISGEGSVSVNLGSTASMFTLDGNNTFTGAKNLTQGVLVAAITAALGDTTANKWILGEQGTLVVLDGLSADNALSYVDASSTGTLALHENMAGVLDMSNHAGLFVGAVAGKVVEYGTAESTLGSVGGKWNLGGGGGELVVNALLNDASAALVLGNGQGLGGIVTLTNENNSIGSITFNEGVTLSFENAAALGGAKINLIYAAALLGAADTPEMLTLVSSSSSGSVLLDRAGSTNIDLSGHASLSLGSAGNTTYSGNITVAENAAYRFGGGSGTLTVTNALQKNGTNNLVVDGQTQSGGKLVLAAASDLTGAISVMGYDSAKTSSQQGDMTLAFSVDNALDSASSLTVHDGGIVDLGTTTQAFTNVQVLAGGVITGAEGSSLVFRMSEDNSVLGSLQLANAEKTGAGSLLLSSSGNTWELLTIKQGAVYTTVDNALSSTGITRVEDGGTLNLGATVAARTVSGNVLLADGGMLLAGSESQSIYFNGSLDVEFGATGTVEGGYWHLSASQTNMSGGTLSFNSSQLHLAPTYAQHFGGSVDIAAGSTTFYSEGAAEDMLKHFNHINIGVGKALTLEDRTWNTIWQLDKLSGEGSMTWNSDTNHNKTARLIISGDGEYSGTINYIRNYSDNPSRTHQSFLEINGQKAASGATLNMTGAHNSYASLALNAERVELGGINGNGYSHIMAGAAPADSASTSAPASSRNSTLVLTGCGDYTYSGSIGSAADSATSGVSIQMSGSGIQNFNGADLYLNDVTALSGSLNISSSNLNVRGDIAVAQGAQLSLGDSFTVASGQSLQVLDSAADAPATFQSALTVASGGSISFEGTALSTTTAALNLAGGVSFSGDSAAFNFFNYGGLKEGTSYVLVSGDWSQLASSITATGLEYFDATFTGTSDSLTMTLSLKDGFLRWDGSDEKHEWGGSTFGKTYYPGAFIGDYYVSGKSVVFDDSAQCTDVVLTNSASPGKATFNASKDYHVSCSANYNYTQTIGELVQEGTGTTTLDAGVVVVTGDAIIKKGTLVVKDAATLRGAVYGDGTLALDLGANGTATPNLTGLNTLHIKSGIFGSTTATAAAAVNNIIIDASGVYAQGAVDYAGKIVAQGGKIHVAGGSLSGSLTLTADSVLEVANGTSTEFKAFINQGEYALTKTGNGTLSLGSQSGSVVLQDIRVQQGTLEYRDASFTAGKITVDAVAMLSFDYAGSLSANLIDLSGTLYLKNGNGSIVNAAIHTNDGAVINGSFYGGGSTITGRVYGEGELHLQSYQNKYTINSVIEDGSDALRIVVENDDPNAGEGVVLSAQNTYSGGTVVKSGVLHVANKQALGTGNVEIAGGTLTLAQDLTINSLSGSAGTLNLNGKTLTVGNGAVTFAARAADSTSTYSGALGSSGSITKVGSDTQVFDSADMQLENVSVQGGTLSLNDVASVSGDIYVASGATLVTGGDAISLGEGQTLTAEAGSSVTLAGLTLNGGTLSLDLGAPTGAPEEAPSLSLVAAVAGSGGVITLVGDLSSLETAQLMLAKGDWSQFANGGLSLESLSLLGGGSTPLSYSLMANSEGLYLSLAAVSDADSNIWAGTTEAHEWDADSFSVYGTGALAEKAIFNDTAAHKTVTLSSTVSTGAVEIVGGGYSFEGSGSIAAGSVSAAGDGASTISNIALSGTEEGTILVDGSELTIVQLTPTNPSAPIALTNAAKLTIGDASHRYGAFSGKVTGDAGSQLHLYTTQVSDTYLQQDGTVQLLDGSTVQDVYIHGDLALNIIAGSQASIGDKFTNLQGANLHMDAGSQLVVRAEEGTGITPTTGNIVLGGDLSIVAYSPVTTATSITSHFTQEEGASTSMIKKDTGSLTLSGNIDVDAIEVQAGTLQLTGSSTSTTVYTVNSGATLALSGSSVYSFDASSERTINGTLKIDSDVNVSGSGRITIAPSGKIELADGASLIRPEGNIGAYWIQGDLVALENATADFSTVDDVHFYEQAGGQIKTESGATLNLTSKSLQYWKDASIVLEDDSVLNLTTTGTDGVKHSGGDANAGLALTLGEGAALNVLGGNVNLNAHSSLVLGADSEVKMCNGAALLLSSDVGSSGVDNSIVLSGGELHLNNNGANTTQTVYSTIEVNNSAATVDSPSTSIIRNDAGVDNMTRILRNVSIAKHNVLELQQFGWNTIWNINALTGEGTLRWAASTNHSISSRLILSGDNSFSGLIELHRSGVDYTWVDNGAYQAYLVLANDGAAKNATISLQGEVSGSNKNNIASLVINTENAAVQGIIGNELSHIYAGEARGAVTRNDSAPGTTVANTLTIAGAGDYTFAGTVGTSADAARLSLAMTGEGKQTFSGQAYVGNVSVSKGELVLSQADVDGSVTVSGGALNMTGSTYTLGSGDVLSVLTGTEHAVQLGNLTLSGGEMVFDASMLSADTSALTVGAVSLGEGTSSQLITFNNIDNLESGRYLLSDSWTAVDGLSFSTGTLAHGAANVVMQDGALYLDYTAAQYYTWTGAADGNWNYSSNNWDNTPDITTDDSVRFIANRVAIFETDANVTVSEAVSADSLIVRNGATLNLTETAALTVNSIEVAEGSTLAFKTPKAGYTVGNISGAGTVELLLTSSKNSITLGENFTGETHVTGGNLVTNNLQVGSTLRLSNSVTMYAQGGDVVSDIVVDGTMDIRYDANVNTLFKGDISGAGTINHRLNGYFEFYGEVDIARFVHTDNNEWGRDWFKNITKIGEVDLHGGHLYFDNDSTIGTLTVSTSGHNRIDFAANYSHSILSATIAGGTVNFNGTSEVAAMTVSGGTVEFKGDLNLQSLNLTGGTVTLKNADNGTGKNKFITNVKLAGGGVLYASFEGNASEANGQNVINLGTLEVNGTGRFGVERSSSCWQGTINIANLTNAAESASSVLTLTAGNQVDYVSVINLNGGSFVGTIKIEDNSAKGNGTPDRKFAVNINDENVAAGAIIQFVEPSSATDTDKAYNHIALGLGSTTVTMAGLSGETTNAANIYAYQIKSGDGFNNKVNESDTAARTLILNVTSETPLTTNAIINGGISLVKTGAGSQTISGVAAVGSVAVQEGALILSNASSTISGDISVSGGQLDFGGTYTLGDSLTLSVLTRTENAVQLGGMTLSGGQMLFDASLLSANSAALSLGSAAVYTAGTTQTVSLDFSKLTGALANGTYKLASGDWSGANNDTLTYNGMGSASFNATADGLYLVYTNDGVYTWVGGAADTNWSSANWDIVPDADAGNNLSFTAGKDAIFNTNATAVVTDTVTAGTVYIMNGAEVTWKMEGAGASLSFAHVDVVNGKLSLHEQTNWTGMAEISVRKDGTLVLNWGTGLAADKLLLQGGTIELRNGGGNYHELNTAITVDGSGWIKGSSTGNYTVIKGSIAGTGTLYFEKINDNPIKIESTMTDGAEGALSVNIGNANIVYAGANLYTGTTSITGGTLELAGAVSMAADGGAIDVASGAKLLLNTTQELTLGNDITGQGTIDKKGNQSVILAGDVSIAKVELANGDQNVGSLTFTGETVKVDKIHAACGNIYIGGVGASTFMQVGSLETGDCSGGDGTTVQISAGSTLSVTSDNNEAGYKTAGIILGEWTRATDLTVLGKMLAKDAKVMVGDNAANVVIDGGVMAVKGFAVADTSSGKADKLQSISIDLKNGGSLILGDAGISTDKAFSATFGEGTVGMSAASTTIAEDVTLNSAEGTTFDTTQYTYKTNAEGVATDIERGTERGDLVLSGKVSSAEGVDAAMKVVGAGTLHVAGESAVIGEVTVDARATLAVSSGSTAKATVRSADGAAAATISGGVTLSHGENSAAIAGRGMDVTEISNSLIELQQGVSLNLSNVHLAADSAVMGAGAAQATSGVMLMEGELTRNDVALESVSVAIALEQNATRGADAAVERVGSKVMMLDSSAFSYNNLTGSLTVEFSGELAAMLLQGGYDAVGLSFTGSEMAADMTILGMYDGITGSTEGIFATDAGSSAVVYFRTDIIPEPATGTLSLLALAALAMRRRRR